MQRLVAKQKARVNESVTSAGETGAPLTKRASERGFNFKFAVDPGGCVLPS